MEGALYQSKLDRVDPASVVRRTRPTGVHGARR